MKCEEDVKPDLDELDGNVPAKPKSRSTKKVAKVKEEKVAVVKEEKPPVLSLSGGDSKGWTDQQLLSDLQRLDPHTSSNIIRLFEDDNTIPFICRYRRELIGDIDADR